MSRGYNLIDIEEAIELRLVNKLTYQQIATYFNVTPQAVYQALKGRIDKNVSIPTISQKRADVLAHQHYRAISAITQDKLDKSSARDLAFTSKLLYEQHRLESNKSTSNSALSFAQMVEHSTVDGF